jgi:hypothetical protein
LQPLDLQFSKEVLEHVKTELHGCKDVAKLLAGINVLSHFALWPEPARSNAIGQLLTLLSYRYPKVLTSTAFKGGDIFLPSYDKYMCCFNVTSIYCSR